MSKVKKTQTESPRERIINTASDLFYKQGYRATGINEVIQTSAVAKATFYHHFPTKEELCLAYLGEIKAREMAFIDNAIGSAKGSVNRFLSVTESLKPWLTQTNFRGCGFLNMASEIPEHTSPLRKPGIALYDHIRDRVAALSQELIESNGKKFAHLDANELSNSYMVIFSGAILLAEIYHAIWPVDHALMSLRRLIGE